MQCVDVPPTPASSISDLYADAEHPDMHDSALDLRFNDTIKLQGVSLPIRSRTAPVPHRLSITADASSGMSPAAFDPNAPVLHSSSTLAIAAHVLAVLSAIRCYCRRGHQDRPLALRL